MIKLHGINWITTYNCNLNCRHCFFDSQNTAKYMDPELIEKALSGFKYGDSMFFNHLSGGELFLDEVKLFAILKNIRKYFHKNIGISTNGFWAKDANAVRERIDKLKQFDVTGIAVSIDYYHEEFLDKKYAQTIVAELSKEDIKTHSYIMGARLSDDVDNAAQVNAHSEAIAIEIRGTSDMPLAPTTIRSIGKGSALNFPKKKEIPQGLCTEMCTCLGTRSPFNPSMVWIDPYGNVMICYGLVIGNLNNNTLNEIIESYSHENNELLKTIADKGPKGLYEKCITNGKAMPEEYYDECDLCYESRKALREEYPEMLTPDECYPV